MNDDWNGRIARRTVMTGASSLAMLALAGRFAGPIGSAQAKPAGGRRSDLPPFDPYARPAQSGPSSPTVPAIGATPSVPGTPYIVPIAPGWSVVSLITAGDTARSGYRMSGVPDGLGAFDNHDGTITVLMNHELSAGKSVVRGHGGRGAYVSRWRIDVASLEVLEGSDLVTRPSDCHLWGGKSWVSARQLLAMPVPPAPGTQPPTGPVRADVDLDRLCSADIAPVAAFYDARHRLGYNGHILLNGEESESRHGRAFAWIDATRAVYELPAFHTGKFGDAANPAPEWENLLANPGAGRNTVVMANSDGGPSRIYLYIGRKQRSGSPIERAGLTNGRLYSLRVEGTSQEKRETDVGIGRSLLGKGIGARVSVVPPEKGTAFLRPEDGAWDPRNPNVYYFATTDRNNFSSPDSVAEGEQAAQIGRSRLWAVTFDDIEAIDTDGKPTARIELLLDGTEGGDMFDNITVDRNGTVYVCEDTGRARHNNKIWAFDTATGSLAAIAKFDPALFGDVVDKRYAPPVPPFVDDKETSGILDVTELFETAPWFREGSTALLVNIQPHFGYDGASEAGRYVYEGGQLALLVKAPGQG